MERYRFANFEELLDRCRDRMSKRYIAEAITCYNGGAFRACIVMTWQAVVFDLMAKIQELKLLGEPQAIQLAAALDTMNGDARKSQEFETQILDKTNGLELLSALERQDLERLRQDRHRCAHPSFHVAFEDYQPTPELARSHIRNAVEHLLSKPPVAGKAALDRLKAMVDRLVLPIEFEDLVQLFRNSPLIRLRKSAVREFLSFQVLQVLLEQPDNDVRRRAREAVVVTSCLQKDLFFEYFKEEINSIVSYAHAQNTESIFWFLTLVDRIPQIQEHLSAASIVILKQALINPNARFRHSHWDLFKKLTAFEGFQSNFAQQLSFQEFLLTCQSNPGDRILIERAFTELKDSGSFGTSNSLGLYCFSPSLSALTDSDLNRIFEIAGENSQVGASQALKNLIKESLASGRINKDKLRELVTSNSKKIGLREMLMLDENFDPLE